MMDIGFETEEFLVKPFNLALNSANVVEQSEAIYKAHLVLRRCAAHEGFFSDYIRGCDGECEGFCKDLSPNCERVKNVVAYTLAKADTLNWEVWRKPTDDAAIDFAGILRLERITVGCDANAHYFFFDGKLRDKTELLKAWNDWVFAEHDGWLPLHRVTIEVPTYAFALARHAAKELGFGGPYEYVRKSIKLPIEGVRKEAMRWRGNWHDLLIMGKTNGISWRGRI